MSSDVSRQTYPFSLSELPYAYDALEPHIDARTLTVHHREHHAGYVKKLNEAVASQENLHRRTLEQLLQDAATLPPETQGAVRNNGGGHLNHDFFWSVLARTPAHAPRGKLAEALQSQFGSLENFREKFSDAANSHFASGWVALAYQHGDARLGIVHLKDHEVLPAGRQSGLLICDVWEHAYYLKYQNRRPEFVEAFWQVVNWPRVEENFARATGPL